MFKSSLALLTTAALGLAATAQADLTWDWSYTSTDGNVHQISASGTLTTDPLSGGGYVITGISGTYVTFPFIGAGTTYSILGLSSAELLSRKPDNTLYTPGYNGSSPADNLQLSFNGLGFTFGAAGGPPTDNAIIADDTATGDYIARDSRRSQDTGIFTAALVPTPEPSQMISMLSLASLGGTGLLLNLRRRK